jgi:hypothetical protein
MPLAAPPPTGFDNVITIGPSDAEWLATMFVGAAGRGDAVRVAIDEGGVKFAVGHHGSWTPAIGTWIPR